MYLFSDLSFLYTFSPHLAATIALDFVQCTHIGV